MQITSYGCNVAAGALFAMGWWWFVDGLVIANQSEGSHFGFQMWLPGLFVSLGLVGVNMLHPGDLKEDGMDGEDVNKAKAFFFLSWLFIFGGLVAGVWICVQDYGSASTTRTTAYPGAAIIMQTVMITLSSAVMWIGKDKTSDIFG